MSVKESKRNKQSFVDAYDLFGLMSTLLTQPDKPDLTTENLWVVALDKGKSILNLELCRMRNYDTVVREPADILSIPLQKKAFGIVLIHNDPTGELIPSEEDIDVTDRLHQAAGIVGIKLLDHLIIRESSFYDF
ncbi:MAG: JAB domain-containing protein [Candidatus Cardinium sp.]